MTVDLSTPEGPAHLIDSALAELVELDILVNNGGAARAPAGERRVPVLD